VAVAHRTTGFVFTEWNREAFVFDVMERSIIGFASYDETKSSFVTWVCNRAWSIANNIIRTSRRDLSKGSGEVGRGKRWPYNMDDEVPFADFARVGDSDEFDIHELAILQQHEPDILLLAVHRWVATALGDDDSRKIIEAIWDKNVGMPYYVPTERGIASRTGFSIAEVREKLAVMRVSLSTIIQETYDQNG